MATTKKKTYKKNKNKVWPGLGWRHSGFSFSFNLFSTLKTPVSYLPCADGNQDSLACNVCSANSTERGEPLQVDLIKSHLSLGGLILTSLWLPKLINSFHMLIKKNETVTFGSLFSTLMWITLTFADRLNIYRHLHFTSFLSCVRGQTCFSLCLVTEG